MRIGRYDEPTDATSTPVVKKLQRRWSGIYVMRPGYASGSHGNLQQEGVRSRRHAQTIAKNDSETIIKCGRDSNACGIFRSCDRARRCAAMVATTRRVQTQRVKDVPVRTGSMESSLSYDRHCVRHPAKGLLAVSNVSESYFQPHPADLSNFANQAP